MPMPMEYQHASADFEQVLHKVCLACNFSTRNQAYTLVQAVLVVFRRRLNLDQGIAFAQVLPPILRALFIDGWQTLERPIPFDGPDALGAEVLAFRGAHNFSPENGPAVAVAIIRNCIGTEVLDHFLTGMDENCRLFWRLDDKLVLE